MSVKIVMGTNSLKKIAAIGNDMAFKPPLIFYNIA